MSLSSFASIAFSTSSPGDHFFGYYGISPWNRDESRLLAHRVDLAHRSPQVGDKIVLGYYDLGDAVPEFVPFADTQAWNFQQGSMLQWCGETGEQVVYNLVDGGRAVAELRDLKNGTTRRLLLPVAALSRDGKIGLSLNFGRLNWARPGYGYAPIEDPHRNVPLPDDDGVFHMNIATGESRLIISLSQMASVDATPDMDSTEHFVNHLGFSPSGAKICFIHLYQLANGDVRSRLMVANSDGSDPRVMIRGMASHFTWLSENELLCWAGDRKLIDSGNGPTPRSGWKQLVPVGTLKRIYRLLGKPRWLMYRIMSDRYYVFDVTTGERKVLGDRVLVQDGHCTASPDGQWVCVDTYPDRKRRLNLGLFDLKTGRYVPVATLSSPAHFEDDTRCDLHPRWSPSGRSLCVDSAHSGLRQMYVIDVSAIVDAA